jgi:hypothetical protein
VTASDARAESPPASPAPARPDRWGGRGLVIVLLGVVLVLGPSVLGDFVWDDVDLITSNANIRDASRLLKR